MSLTKTPPDSVLESLQTARLAAGDGHSTSSSPKKNGNGHAIVAENSSAVEEDHANGLSLSLAADISREGAFGERWLTVDERRVRVFSPADLGAPAHVDLDMALSDIKEARAEVLVGTGALELIAKDGRVIEAVRYTQALAPQFSGAARALESFIKGEAPPDSVLEGFERKYCKKCGLPLPEDTQVCPGCVDKRAVLARLLAYSAPYKMRTAMVVLLSFVGVGLGYLPAYLNTKVLIDRVLVPHRHENWIGWIVIASVTVSILTMIFGIWRGRVAAWLSNHMVFRLRTEVYNKLQNLSLAYYDKRQVGSLMARVTQDVNELQNFLVDGVQYFFVQSLMIFGVLIIMLSQNVRLTLLALIPVPVTVYFTRKLWQMLWKRLHRMWHLRSSLSGLVNSVLSGARVVKAFAQENREKQRFHDKAGTYFNSQLIVEQAWATYFPILALLATLGTYLIYYYGGQEVFHNFTNNPADGMTLGTLLYFLFLLGMLMAPIQGMTRVADWMSRSTAAAERVFEVLDTDVEVAEAPGSISMPHIHGDVELRDVHFTYDKNKMVLEGVSIEVKAGEMIGLVGHSGAGKSTIINLLSRFYDVTEGQILVDGVDIRKIKLDDLRHQVGVVLQEPFLFPGTVRDNIAYAEPDATIEEIMRVAKAANAHDFIMRLPDGYDTWVGERGARLSGGERQRISIARAILHNPRILILDEATASVDTETEKQIQEAISHLIQGRTTFAIAHRLSTLRNADRLMVMDKGKVAELGTHDELLAKPEGVYKRLVEMQQAVNKLREETEVL